MALEVFTSQGCAALGNELQSRDEIESLHTLNRTTMYGTGTGLSDRRSVIDAQTTREPMDNVYRAIMPLTGSTSRMGVTITTKKIEKATPRKNQALNQRSLMASSVDAKKSTV